MLQVQVSVTEQIPYPHIRIVDDDGKAICLTPNDALELAGALVRLAHDADELSKQGVNMKKIIQV
jgi:translation initiation factor IF-3